ncbi:carbamoyltransferase HypF [Actinosynnema sp. ALI-1.44]|uniref:carbamoyltransferase HypF n=1 Tax=Actinosynnema sp. ALI-1.44 TaxID=1933779 RepID=UPI00097CA8B7|nr:carbamoyltransferase HypF [Actinosynnema sp. ALI-1.44]ONI76466.1 carbamoyltransferase HypF [Actinosynnema sp. ALI-1.44]
MTSVRRTLTVRGIVQGVGFRPFVVRVAGEHGLGGWTKNGTGGAVVCVEGRMAAVEGFTRALREHPPPLAVIETCEYVDEEITQPVSGFRIERSDSTGPRRALVPADTHVCDPCRAELLTPDDRRYRYPLINCTDCGPRFSIIRDIPYDRESTTMADFRMCPQCQSEYDTVTDRRFHAQPNACPVCGPRVRLVATDGQLLAEGDCLPAAAELLRAGATIAVKAHGGYQLMVNAADNAAVGRLRARKERGGKPFAVLADDVGTLRQHAHVSAAEAELLRSAARPIVLLTRLRPSGLAEQVAPGLGTLGAMLPSTPMQHLLLSAGFPVLVATSGNAPGEPMATTADQARRDLGTICDAFLEHNREIHARVDDSIARVLPLATGPRQQVIRRARGHVPRPITPPFPMPAVLAVGPELKNTACLASGDRLILGQHIGDLKSEGNRRFLVESVEHLRHMFDMTPAVVAHDLHPDFYSTRYAGCLDLPRIGVQHHHAHMASCMLDNNLDEPVLGVIFDGTGLGTDGTIWGGEFLAGDYRRFSRLGHLRPFRLPGGDRAVLETDRVALALLFEAFGEQARDLDHAVLTGRPTEERDLLLTMCAKGVNAPVTSSAGRMFDGVSALLGVCTRISYEAEAAILLEELLGGRHDPAGPWPVRVTLVDGKHVVDTRPWIRAIAGQVTEVPAQELSRRFHESLATAVVEVCCRMRRDTGLATVVCSGGVFLNRYLAVSATELLTAEGFRVLHHSRIPPTDGGVSAGQAMVAAAHLRAGQEASQSRTADVRPA